MLAKLLICLSLCGQVDYAEFLSARKEEPTAQRRAGRVVVLVSPWCGASKRLLSELESGAFPRLKQAGWTIGNEGQVEVVNLWERPEFGEHLGATDELPVLLKLEGGNAVRRLVPGCGTPIDEWSIGWLAKGIDERPKSAERKEPVTVETTGRYPVRGGWWSVDGNWNPSRAYVVNHLMGGQHAGKFSRTWLESLSFAELQSVHSDDHEGRLQTAYLAAKRTAAMCPT